MATDARSRRDVERNHQAILTAAIAVLADTPEATMNEIAHASGVGRSTLYRHFPDRAALVAAIYQRVHADAEAVITEQMGAAGDRDPVSVLTEITVSLSGLGDRYRFLEHQQAERAAKAPEGARDRVEPLLGYIAAGQSTGTIRTDLDAEWLLTMLAHVALGAAKHRKAGEPDRAAVIVPTLRSLLSPPR